ncbi:MAG: glutamate--tRNA ligase [Clostridia bacterium]|nr:glutamate--tRNA ligase [Clostridia bacterium]
MNYETIAELLYPHITKTPADVEASFPARNLPEGAKVTRLAPSPTGFMHFGTLFPALVNERLAHQSEGVFFLRIEDTDAKREVKGAEEDLINTLAYYHINFDEGAISGGDNGIYAPYRQSKRADIYQVFAKDLIKKGLAYPSFTSEEEYEQLKDVDKKTEIKNKEWSAEEVAKAKEAMLAARAITEDEVRNNLAKGNPFVIRIMANGDPEKKTPFTDLVRGKLEIPENDEDFVLLKSDGIPTYHFAHAVDDHLMGTTHVIRGEEWLPSLAKHIMLFKYLGFRLPKYLHISQLMKMEGTSKKKLSKRDKGAALSDYKADGYPAESVIEYVMTLLNSNYEDWRRANPTLDYTEFPFSIKKMSVSGSLFDYDKLNDVSKNVISLMSADKVYTDVTTWASEYDEELYKALSSDEAYAKKIFAIGRGGKKPRKDFAVWRDVKPYLSFFYDDLFTQEDEISETFDKADIKKALDLFMLMYDPADDNNAWFEAIKRIADEIGFASDMKAYKQNPELYKGNVADVSMFLRVAVTGKLNSPDLYEVMKILGYERTINRIHKAIMKYV